MSDFRKLQSIKIEQLEKENEALTVDLRQAVRQIEALNTDLKEAEGAVADLMTLNDTLTGEVVLQSDDIKTLLSENNRKEQNLKKAEAEVARVKAYPTEEAYLAVCEARTHWMDRAEKAEAEVERLDKVAGIAVLEYQCADLEGLAAMTFSDLFINSIKEYLTALNHKEG